MAGGMTYQNPFYPGPRYTGPQAPSSPEGQSGLTATGGISTLGPDGRRTQSTQYGPGLESELGTREKYNAIAAARQNASLQGMLSSTQAVQPHVTGGTQPFDEQAARQAAFARAKEQSGQIARSSLEGLRNSLSRRGISGGGYAQMRGAEALAPATDRLQDFTREQLIQDLNRGADVSDRNYTGDIQQRGQDAAQRQSLLSLIASNSGRGLY